jgi:hypothetical protein
MPTDTKPLRRSAPCKAALMLVSVALALTCAVPTPAARPVRVYEASVKAPDATAAAQEAMREVLVRATGRRDAAGDPVFAPLVTNANHYVQSSRGMPDGSTLVVFDSAAIERDVTASGRSVWDSERPFTIVVLNPPLTGAAADSARRSLEETAEGRGLPVSLVPMALTDSSSGTNLSNDAVLQSAQRLGGDAALVGRADTGASSGQWHWTLLTGFSTESWTGGFDAGVNGAADALARVQGSTMPMPEAEAVVEVTGVSTLSDYASVERILNELPGARRSGLQEAEGTTATFRILIRGGSEAVERALSGSPRFTRTGIANGRLMYQYHP